MVASRSAEDLVDSISSKHRGVKLEALRTIKNQIIGNKRRKKTFIQLNALESISELLSENDDKRVVMESAVVMGSLVWLSDHSLEESQQAAKQLLKVLDSQDEKVLEAILRSLFYLFQKHGVNATAVDVQQILQLLKHSSAAVQVAALRLLPIAAKCISVEKDSMESSILPELCRVLAVHPSISGVQEAAIDACGSLLLQQPCAGLREIADEGLIGDLLARLQAAVNDSGPKREFSVRCCAVLSALCLNLPADIRAKAEVSCLGVLFKVMEVPSGAPLGVPLLIRRLFQTEPPCFGSLPTLRRTMTECLLAQVFSCNARLRDDLDNTKYKDQEHLTNLLVALSLVVGSSNDALGQVLGVVAPPAEGEPPKELPEAYYLYPGRSPHQQVAVLVEYMKASKDPEFVLAIMTFLRRLSASVKGLRLLEDGFLNCIAFSLEVVQKGTPQNLACCACAFLTNIVSCCSPTLQGECDRQGYVAAMVGLLGQEDSPLFGLAAQGLANFSYASTPEQKKRIMEAMPGAARVKAIIGGHFPDHVKVSMMCMLKNLASDGGAQASREFVAWVTPAWIATSLLCGRERGSAAFTDGSNQLRSEALSLLGTILACGRTNVEQLGHDMTTHRLLEELIGDSEPAIARSALNIVRTLFGGDDEGSRSRRRAMGTGGGDGGDGLARIVAAIQQCLIKHEGDTNIKEHCESALEALM